MPVLILGRNQTVSVDGVSTGTREIDIDVTTKTADVTSYLDEWESTLVLTRDIKVRLTAYHKEVYDAVVAKINKHPPQPMVINISGAGSMNVVPTAVKIKSPIDGVVAWDIEFSAWSKQ